MKIFTFKLAGWLLTLRQLKNIKKSNLESLSPRILTKDEDIKKIQPYLTKIEDTLLDPYVTNIAVAGGYGAGKSTIIKTFQSLHSEYSYLNISLASFKDNDENRRQIKDETNESDTAKTLAAGENIPQTKQPQTKTTVDADVANRSLERRLEISILQQIFYSVKSSKIPDSRFKRIRNTKTARFSLLTLGFVLWLISAFLFCFSDNISVYKIWKWDMEWKEIIAGAIFIGGLFIILRLLIRFGLNSKINKVNLKGELELGEKIDNSVFNQYLEEIIYFFETTKYDVVVIEDLDRFETTDIFTKLRELNILLNNSKLIKRDNGVKFIYAIKDEMFKDKSDRVKFFDFIIPIIPFINASNADTQLARLIESKGLENVLSKDFVQDIVTFIDDIDMRLLTNIFHEFCIYKELINVEVWDNLFAIIVYKNMYPDDFGLLARRQGDLYAFISNKNDYTQAIILDVSKKINGIESEIRNIEREKLRSIDELRAVYILAIQKAIPNATSLVLNGNNVLFSEAIEEGNFEALQSEKDILYRSYSNSHSSYYNISSSNSGKDFEDIEQLVSDEFSYEDRAQYVAENYQEELDKLRIQLAELKKKKIEVENWSIKEIFEIVKPDVYLSKFSNNELMRNLLLNGYINEDYNHYITIFHAGVISQEDYEFERKVKSGISLSINFQLSKIEELIKKIPDKYFKREVILNISLLDFLLDHIDEYPNKYKKFTSLLVNPTDNAKSFTERYIRDGRNMTLFVKEFSRIWNGWWDHLLEDNSNEMLSGYLNRIIKYATLTEILKLDTNKKLSNFINNKPNFISLFHIDDYVKVKQVIDALNIRFEALDNPTSDAKDVFDYIYENELYAINYDNIVQMIGLYSEKFGAFSEIADEQSNYTQLIQSECSKLIDYIDANISHYVKSVLLKENILNESEDLFVRLLNHKKLDVGLKLELVKKQSNSIGDISYVEDIAVQRLLFAQNKVAATWSNIISYYGKLEVKAVDETLLNFIESEGVYGTLSKLKIKESVNSDEDFIKELSLKLIYCNEFSYDTYVQIMRSTPYVWNSLNFEELDKDKVEWMVETNFLTLTASNVNKLKEYFPDLHIALIEKQSNDLISQYSTFAFELSDIQKLLVSNALPNLIKIELLEKLDEDILSDTQVCKIACGLLAEGKQIQLEKDIIIAMMASANSTEVRIKVLTKYMTLLNNSELQGVIEGFMGDYVRIFKKQNKPTFVNTEYHNTLFDELRRRQMIIRYVVQPRDNRLKVYAKY